MNTVASARLLLCLVFLCFLSQNHSYGYTIRYVSTDGTNTLATSATSWSTATNDLQGAILASKPGDQVWVAAGTYKPGLGLSQERTSCFTLLKGVTVLGGFKKGASTVNERSWIDYPTILSGDIGIPDDSTDNCYVVIQGFNLDETAIVDGFSITKGNNNRQDEPPVGGGLLLTWHQPASQQGPIFRHCRFAQNYATNSGGAVGVVGNSPISGIPRFESCWFIDNSSGEKGGAIYLEEMGAVFSNCLFTKNTADYGAAFYTYFKEQAGELVLLNCTAVQNKARISGPFLNLANHNSKATTTLINCIFWKNEGDAQAAELEGQLKFTHCLFDINNLGLKGSTNLQTRISPFRDESKADYRLKPGSRAIDAGTNELPLHQPLDLSGHPRLTHGRIDVGCFEYQPD